MGGQRDPACQGLEISGLFRARMVGFCGVCRFGSGSAREVLWHGSSMGCMATRCNLAKGLLFSPNAVRPAGPQTLSRRGQPPGWLQVQKHQGLDPFSGSCARTAELAGLVPRWGPVDGLWIGPTLVHCAMADPPIEAANWIRPVAPSPGDSGGLPGGSVRGGPWQGYFSALISVQQQHTHSSPSSLSSLSSLPPSHRSVL